MHITAGLRISRAFILGAGLGTRLRPLTGILPKPLIPFFHEPLILHSMRRCYDCGIREFIINTHHLAAAWDKVFPEHSWNGCPVHFSHEPVLLDSGGGVKKIEPLASAEEPLLVVNGDMAATFDLGRLLEAGDLLSPCRRLLVMAAEDVGLAYPQAMAITKACVDAARELGLPEGRLPLAEAAVLLATAPKSNSAYNAINAAMRDIRKGKVGQVPRHLQNVHADSTGSGKAPAYKYPHDYPHHYVAQRYLPEALGDVTYYEYGDNKTEQAARRYWEDIKKN